MSFAKRFPWKNFMRLWNLLISLTHANKTQFTHYFYDLSKISCVCVCMCVCVCVFFFSQSTRSESMVCSHVIRANIFLFMLSNWKIYHFQAKAEQPAAKHSAKHSAITPTVSNIKAIGLHSVKQKCTQLHKNSQSHPSATRHPVGQSGKTPHRQHSFECKVRLEEASKRSPLRALLPSSKSRSWEVLTAIES